MSNLQKLCNSLYEWAKCNGMVIHPDQTLINKLEMVQRKSARWIVNKWKYDQSPTEILNSLKLKPLEKRREMNCLKMLHNIINGRKFISTNILPQKQRCSTLRFKPTFARLMCFENSFFPHTTKLWNSLPAAVVDVKSFNGFKTSLENYYA